MENLIDILGITGGLLRLVELIIDAVCKWLKESGGSGKHVPG